MTASYKVDGAAGPARAPEVDVSLRAAAVPSTAVIAVLGSGSMGQGIAQIAVLAGHPVQWFNRSRERLEAGIDSVRARLTRLAEKGLLTAEQAREAGQRLHPVSEVAGLAEAELVLESVAEDLELKQRLFAELEEVLAPGALLSTNTSSLSINRLASKLKHPERFLGLHFFNPAPLMKLVEVVPGMRTEGAVTDRALATLLAWGKTPVTCRPSPGFIVNRVARPFYTEALRLLDEGNADPAVIDSVLTGSGGFAMGPLALTDLIGQDVNAEVTRQIWSAFGHDARFTPSLTQQALVEAGLLGRKTGRGFFTYEGSSGPRAVPGGEVSSSQRPSRVTLHGGLGPAHPVVEVLRHKGVEVESRPLAAHEGGPDGLGFLELPGGLAVTVTDGRTAYQRARALGRPVVVFDLALDYRAVKHLAVAASHDVQAEQLERALALIGVFAGRTAVFRDSPGLVVARTVCMLINEATDVVAQGVCSAEAVEIAMRLAVNYPVGLLHWGDSVGAPWVCTVLDHLATILHPTRYRVAPALRAAAITGKKLLA